MYNVNILAFLLLTCVHETLKLVYYPNVQLNTLCTIPGIPSLIRHV